MSSCVALRLTAAEANRFLSSLTNPDAEAQNTRRVFAQEAAKVSISEEAGGICRISSDSIDSAGIEAALAGISRST